MSLMFAKLKAIVYYKHGDAKKLVYEERPKPVIEPNEVLVRIKACALNRLDILSRKGIFKIEEYMPHILGSDISGIVNDVGSNVKDIKIGSNVMVYPYLYCGKCFQCSSGNENYCSSVKIIGSQIDGGYAEYVKIPERNIISISGKFSFEQYAAMPVDLTTVWNSLMTRGKLKMNESILIWAAGSGAGTIAIQLAKLIGAKVFTTVGLTNKIKRAQQIGADLVLNHYKDNIPSIIQEHTDGKGVDVVLDFTGASTWQRSIVSLRVGGRLLCFGGTSGYNVDFNIRQFYTKQLTLIGTYGGTKSDLIQALSLAEQEKMLPVIDSILPLKEAWKAHEKMEKSKHFGKIVLTP